jgi:uncharacterized YigZ family protein
MKTIEDSNYTIVINKSKFICELLYINNQDEIDSKLKDIKHKYKGATHYCYAYIYDNNKRFNDDGEPGGTAGMPILNVLENNNLNHVLCVVIRYFGGIKLGAGGLVRAYTKSVTSCLENTKIIDKKECQLIKITFSYDKVKIIDKIINKNILLKEFENSITYTIAISKDEVKNTLKLLENYIINLEILDDNYIN